MQNAHCNVFYINNHIAEWVWIYNCYIYIINVIKLFTLIYIFIIIKLCNSLATTVKRYKVRDQCNKTPVVRGMSN